MINAHDILLKCFVLIMVRKYPCSSPTFNNVAGFSDICTCRKVDLTQVSCYSYQYQTLLDSSKLCLYEIMSPTQERTLVVSNMLILPFDVSGSPPLCQSRLSDLSIHTHGINSTIHDASLET